MSCHGPAEVPLRSFILPSPSPAGKPGAPTFTANGVMVLNPPGSAAWNQWFQDRNGSTPQDQGTVAVDYDMVLAFKSIPAWNTLQGNLGAAPLPTRTGRPRLYNGK
jgi:hypothetical protein